MGWIAIIPSVFSAFVQLAKIIMELMKDKKTDEVKACSIALENARKSGDTTKLDQIISRMKEGKTCD